MKNKKAMFTSKTVEWETPASLFEYLDKKYQFTLDPCASDDNHKVEKYYTKEIDGLSQSWEGEVVFMNPPYGRDISEWIRKAYSERNRAKTIVMLLPARTDTKWFHSYIYNKTDIEFIKGRLKFGGTKNSAPFPSLIAVLKPDKPKKRFWLI